MRRKVFIPVAAPQLRPASKLEPLPLDLWFQWRLDYIAQVRKTNRVDLVGSTVEVFGDRLRCGGGSCFLGWKHGLQRRQEASGGFSRLLGHQRVDDDQCCHSLDDRNGPWNDTWVVSSLRLQGTLFGVVGGSLLRLADRSGWLERDPEVNVLTVGDATLDAARVICLGGQFRSRGLAVGVDGWRGNEGVVVDRPWDFTPAEARSDLKALGGGDAQHGMC